jgi:hypothetical protein
MEVKVGPLNAEEAERFIELLFHFRLKRMPSDKEVQSILKIIGVFFPYYFQLLIKEMADLADAGQKEDLVNKAFQNLVANGNIHLQHYKSRLRKIFDSKQQGFVTRLLLRIKTTGGLQRQEILNLAEGEGLRDELDDILDTLFHDGYLTEVQDKIGFYSIILENWWK